MKIKIKVLLKVKKLRQEERHAQEHTACWQQS